MELIGPKITVLKKNILLPEIMTWLLQIVHRHRYEQLELFSLHHTGGNIHLLLARHNVNINSVLYG